MRTSSNTKRAASLGEPLGGGGGKKRVTRGRGLARRPETSCNTEKSPARGGPLVAGYPKPARPRVQKKKKDDSRRTRMNGVV